MCRYVRGHFCAVRKWRPLVQSACLDGRKRLEQQYNVAIVKNCKRLAIDIVLAVFVHDGMCVVMCAVMCVVMCAVMCLVMCVVMCADMCAVMCSRNEQIRNE